MKSINTLGIVGAGNVGVTLAILAQRTGQYEVVLGARNSVETAASLLALGVKLPVVSLAEAARSDLVLLTVPDSAIRSVCDSLSKEFQAGSVVAHCSGALTSDELSGAGDSVVASMHPLQTFPDVSDSLGRVAGTYCYYEGDDGALPAVIALAERVGMQPVVIKKSAKTLYHASAVMACNYLSALMDASLELAEAAGVQRETMWHSLKPLVRATMDNIDTQGVEKALTGPIVRGDAITVKNHLDALSNREVSDKLLPIYTALGTQAIDLAKRSERTPAAKLELVNNTMLKYIR